MSKTQKWGFGSFMLIFDFFLLYQLFLRPNNLNFWAKVVILGLALLGQAFSVLGMMTNPGLPKSKEKKPFALTDKLYILLILKAMGIYTIGIWLITPDQANGFKAIFLGTGLVVLTLLFLYFGFKKVNEQPDERFYMNLAKSASLMFALTILLLLIFTYLTASLGSLPVSTGTLCIIISLLLLIFPISFFIFEKRG